MKKIFEPKAPSLIERRRGLKLYFDAGIDTRLSCMPILPLDPENVAAQVAPFITTRVWIAAMNHKQLTNKLFQEHFPEWLTDRHVEKMMKKTAESFLEIKVPAFYNSLAPQAKEERWAKREAKIANRKNVISAQTVEKIIENKPHQPSLFD